MLGDTSPLDLGSIIKIVNPKTDVFKYMDDHYHIKDFEKVTVYDNSYELIIADYDYVDFNNLKDILEYDIVTIPKNINKIGCKIRRLYNDTHIEGITVEKPVEDHNVDTIAYQYIMPNGMLSGIKSASIHSNEWISVDTETVLVLKPIEKIKYLLKDTNADCQEVVRKMREFVFVKQ